MPIELINTHCHTKYCGHGEGEVAQYAKLAHDAGLTTLALTDHYPLTHAFDPDEYICVTPERLPAYIDAVKDAKGAWDDMEVLLGTELDYLGADEDREGWQSDLDEFDLVLMSVHYVDRWPFDDPAQRGAWDEPGAVDRIWRRYIDLWCEAAANRSLRAEVMSHPDLAKKFAYYPTFDLAPAYSQMAEAAREGGRMIELNTSGTYYACKEMFPAPGLLHEFCRAGVPCTVGTDAHVPANVTRDINKAYKAMHDAGYREVTVPTAARDRRTIRL